ncbi:MAG: glycosyltransferase family 4 protein [Haloechinothrix sp.]
MNVVRVAQVAPIARAVGPQTGSSIEDLVWLLTEELVQRGHDVTLFATGDSRTSARLQARYPVSYHQDSRLWNNWQFHELVHTAAAFERGSDFDVIHSHVYAFPAPFSRMVDTPVVHTDHIPTERDLVRCYARYPETHLVALSEYHRRKLQPLSDVAVVPNGIDTDSFPFGPTAGDYLLFLGHLISRKAPVEAIRVARNAGIRLVLAGKGSDDYFTTEVKPLIDGRHVEHVGQVGVEERNALLAGAGALVFTSVAREPFGLVLVEAMACGTPVIALDRCAVPEIVEPGVTGCYADDVDRLAELVPAALAIDRNRVREEARRRFDYRRMTDDYERLYERLARSADSSIPAPATTSSKS